MMDITENVGNAAATADDIPLDEGAHPRRRDDVETAILPDGSCLLFDPVTNNGHALNASGALIWDCCDGHMSVGAVADELAGLVPHESQLRDQAIEMIHTLVRLGLLLPAS